MPARTGLLITDKYRPLPASAPNSLTTFSALARTGDRPTSIEAAQRMVDSGAARSHLLKILAVLAHEDGLTATAIGARCGLTNVQVCRRSREIEASGYAWRRVDGQREGGWFKRETGEQP